MLGQEDWMLEQVDVDTKSQNREVASRKSFSPNMLGMYDQ